MLSKIIFTFLIMLSTTYVKAKAQDKWISEQESKGNVKYSKVDGVSYIKVTEVYDGFGSKDMKREYIYKVLPSGEKKIAARKVIIINPYELRELEVGDKYWIKDDPSTKNLQDTYSSFLKKIDGNLLEERACHNICEEVTEKYVICNGNKYILDIRNDDRLKQDVKRIENYIGPSKSDLDSKAVSK